MGTHRSDTIQEIIEISDKPPGRSSGGRTEKPTADKPTGRFLCSRIYKPLMNKLPMGLWVVGR